MAGNGDLIRSMRSGGGAGVTAAQELLRRAQRGAVSTAELKEAQKVATSPELRDVFRGVARDVTALLSSGTGRVFRDVSALLPDAERLIDARALPERFLGDLVLVEQELLNHPGMTKDQKAARLFAFFETYAARFVALAHGTAQAAQPAKGPLDQGGALATAEAGLQLAPALTEAELNRSLLQFDKALTRAGFGALRADDGRTGMEAARQMLEAKTKEAQARVRPACLEAPGWKDNAPVALRGEVDQERRALNALDVRGPVQPQLRVAAPKVEEAPQEDGVKKKERSTAGTDQVLGGDMLWNVMHLLRGEELDDVARKDAMTQLAVAAALLLILGAILVAVLVWV